MDTLLSVLGNIGKGALGIIGGILLVAWSWFVWDYCHNEPVFTDKRHWMLDLLVGITILSILIFLATGIIHPSPVCPSYGCQ